MAHPRKFADHPIVVYRYWAQPTWPRPSRSAQPIPEALWRLSTAMQALWNQLCQIYTTARQQADALPASAAVRAAWKETRGAGQAWIAAAGLPRPTTAAVRRWFQHSLRLARDAVRTDSPLALPPPQLPPGPEADAVIARLTRQLHDTVASLRTDRAHREAVQRIWSEAHRQAEHAVTAAGLPGELGEETLVRVQAAMRRARTTGKGWPQPHHQPRSIMLHHRYAGGGAPISSLFSPRSTRFRLTPPIPRPAGFGQKRRCPQRLTRGQFAIGSVSIPFTTILHRPLPPAGMVKRVSWCGRRHPSRGWQWSIAISVESPYPHPTPVGGLPACGLDLGWRLMGDWLRVGVVADSDGRTFELRLPLALTDRTWIERHKLPCRYADIAAYDAEAARQVEEAKARLRDLLSRGAPSAELRERLAGLATMRQSGIRRVAWWLLSQDGSLPDLQAYFRRWLREADRTRSLRKALEDRLCARRQWLYGNLARWLTSTYRTIVIEGDLSLKDLKEDEDAPPALKAARQYMKAAALSSLRDALTHAAAKAGCAIVRAPAAYTTAICHRCGAQLPTPSDPWYDARLRGELYLTCPQGHRWDQDVNAARNLLAHATSHIPGLDPHAGDLRNSEGAGEVEDLVIPEILRAVVVPVQLG